MTPKDILNLTVAAVLIGIVLYLFFWYIDSMMKQKHEEMEHSCNGGLTDDEVKELTKEDK